LTSSPSVHWSSVTPSENGAISSPQEQVTNRFVINLNTLTWIEAQGEHAYRLAEHA
jgi:hypothetical protein